MLQKEEKADSVPVAINNQYFPLVIASVVNTRPYKFDRGLFYRYDIIKNVSTGKKFKILNISWSGEFIYEPEDYATKLEKGDKVIFLWCTGFSPATYGQLIRELLTNKEYTNRCDLLYDVTTHCREIPDGVIRYILNPKICSICETRLPNGLISHQLRTRTDKYESEYSLGLNDPIKFLHETNSCIP